MRVAVVDVGMGNLRSVERALRAAGQARRIPVEVEVTRDPSVLRASDKLVMPGQGAFGPCARALFDSRGLGEALRERIAHGAPYLGICLGLQVLFESSEEAPGVSGLGVLRGTVARLAPGIDPDSGQPRKLPHVGWNVVEPEAGDRARERVPLPSPGEHFYFVHGYAAQPADARVVAATTEYGERFVSAVAHENVVAWQFHPEKSAAAGRILLERFLAP